MLKHALFHATVVLSSLCLLPTSAQSAVFSVGPVSDPGCTHTDLQAAISAAVADPAGPHRIKIARADIEFELNAVGEAYALLNPQADISIEGNFSQCSDEFSANDGNRSTIRLSSGSVGRVMRIELPASPARQVTLREIALSGGNTTSFTDEFGYGAGLRVSGAGAVKLDRSAVLDSRAARGGGVAVLSGARLELINGSSVGNNRAETSTGRGGGIYCQGSLSSVLLGWASVLQNHSAGNGGGIYLDDCGGLFSLDTTLGFTAAINLSNNSAGEDGVSGRGYGGAIYSLHSSIEIDSASSSPYLLWMNNNSGHRGGAVYLDSDNSATTSAQLAGAAYTNNFARDRGGAFYLRNSASLSVFHRRSTPCTLSAPILGQLRSLNACSLFAGNLSLGNGSASAPGAAVVYATATSAQPALVDIQRSLIAFNQDSGRAAVAYINNARFRLRNSRVHENSAAGSTAGGLGPVLFQLFAPGPHLLQHTTVLGNGGLNHMAEVWNSQLDLSGSIVHSSTMQVWNPQSGASLRHRGCLLTHPNEASLPSSSEEIAPGLFSDGPTQADPQLAADGTPVIGSRAIDGCSAVRVDAGLDFFGRARGRDAPGVVNFPFAGSIAEDFFNDLGAVEAAGGDGIFHNGFESLP
ncbi:hypothetical protein [Pseudomarimonas arenosa]|uniref:Outer membrane repeat protein n=1 Tax=Pseudomarimonas arenosa TaxID=2774145 RepID=A0AAW3ZIB5_9GAMM|nr:hypothetical protein [Pseudomarimonas arenosa]MBD8525825.1 hypothetical protein [Pseudomarimonas arenosa]